MEKPLEEVLGKNDTEIYDDPEVGHNLMAIDRRIMDSGVGEVLEERVQTPRGYRTFLTTKTPYRDQDGRVVGIVGMARDITDRKRTEDALKESEERFRILSGATFEAIVIHADDMILDVNQAAIEQTGYSRDEVIGRPVLDFFPPEAHVAVREAIRQPVVERYETKLRLKDGELRTVQIKARTMELHGRSARVATIMDITEQKRAMNALSESEAKYRSLLENAQGTVAIWEYVWDDENELIDARLQEANSQTLKNYGAEPPEKVLGMLRSELIGRDFSEKTIPIIRQMQASRTPVSQETHYGDRDYLISYFPIDKDRYATTSADITEIRRVQRTVEDERARLRTILETLPVGVALANASGNVVERNESMQQVWGMDMPLPDGIERYAVLKGWRPNTGERYRAEDWAMARALLRGETIVGEVIDIERFDGKRATIINTAAPIRNSEGKIIGAVVTAQDISELRDLERDLKRSNTELQQFAYVASHDMKEPLRMVTSYLGLLEKNNKDKLDPKSKEYVHYALDGAKRMAGMIDDLLAYSRVETKGNELSMVDMNDVLVTVLRDLRMGIKESGASVTNEALPSVTADRRQMAQLLQNLVGNAIKYRSEEAPQIHISAHEDGRDWVFAVADNGIGIDPRYKDRLFQMFQRLHTRDEYEGTGMGLAISKKIIERHGGRIWFESKPGEGSTFYFSIPTRT